MVKLFLATMILFCLTGAKKMISPKIIRLNVIASAAGVVLALPFQVYSVYVPPPTGAIYKSGKAPIFSTGEQKDTNKGSYTGSKKEITFLRCMSRCKTRCQAPAEGLARNDCVQDCQDICCNSYEQCSFKIKSTIGNVI